MLELGDDILVLCIDKAGRETGSLEYRAYNATAKVLADAGHRGDITISKHFLTRVEQALLYEEEEK